MKEIFQLLELIPKVKESLEKDLAGVSPDWVVRAGASQLLKFVLEQAVKEGPTSDLAEGLNLTQAQAEALYKRVLENAIARR